MAYAMKKVNGSECTCDDLGLITQLRDGQGRSWTFVYAGKQLLKFTDPSGNVWASREARWIAERVQPGTATPRSVAINHATGEIRIEDNVRVTVYKPDGTTHVEVVQIIDDVPVSVRFIEYPTHPNRSFVVVERPALPRGATERVTWIQDAQLRLYKLEYDAVSGRLVRYVDMASKPAVTWTANYDAAGNIAAWRGEEKGTGRILASMSPMLVSVDLSGNRHFISANGARIIVDPTGAAFAAKSPASQSAFAGVFQTAALRF